MDVDSLIGAGLWSILMSMTFIPQIVPNGIVTNTFLFLVWPAFLYVVINNPRFNINMLPLVIAAVATWGISLAMGTNDTIKAAWKDPKNPKNRASAIGSYFGLVIMFGFIMFALSLFNVHMYETSTSGANYTNFSAANNLGI